MMTEYTIQQAARALIINAKRNIPTMLLGQPGVGKSDVVREAARQCGATALIDIRVSQLDSVDARGLPVADLVNGTTRWLTPSMLPDLTRDGAYPWLFLDEITNGQLSVQAAFYQLVLDRRLGDYVLPDTAFVCAAGNRTSDKSAAQRVSKALIDRFSVIPCKVDVDAWLAWARRNNIAPCLQAFIAFRRHLLSTIDSGTEQFATPRSVAACSPYCDDTLTDAELRMMVATEIGDDVAGEFLQFLPMFRDLPTPHEIVANPDTSLVPVEPSLCYAIACALADIATRGNIDAVMTYANRLEPEYRELLVSDAVTRDETLKETAAYVSNSIARSVR